MGQLYLDKNSAWNKIEKVNYIGNFTPGVKTVDNGIILPVKKINGDYCGGVCDSDLNFVAGRSEDWCGVKKGYSGKPDKIVYETVLFGGIIMLHFGHMLVDSMTRLWWLCENEKYTGKIVFCVEWGELNQWVYEWFSLLGISKDRIVLIFHNDKINQFKRIIVPEEAVLNGKFSDKYLLPASLMAKNALKLFDSKELPSKIYLTRSLFQGGATTYITNEDYMENFFKDKGYSVISLEKLSVSNQVALLANAQAVASNLGTLSHMILFSKQGVSVDVWLRDEYVIDKQMAIFQLKKADYRLIDADMSFLPHTHIQGVTLCGPTASWISYVKDYWGERFERTVLPERMIVDYLKKWAQYIMDYPETIKSMKLNETSCVKIFSMICKNLLCVDVENDVNIDCDRINKIEQQVNKLDKMVSSIKRIVCDNLLEEHGDSALSNWALDDKSVWQFGKFNDKKVLTLKIQEKFVRINLPLSFNLSLGDEVEYYITYLLKTDSGSARLMLEDKYQNFVNLTILSNCSTYRTIQGKFICRNNGFNSLMLTSTDFVGDENNHISFEVISLRILKRGAI